MTVANCSSVSIYKNYFLQKKKKEKATNGANKQLRLLSCKFIF